MEVDPDFFEGTNQDGAGHSPHLIMMSFIKDKIRIRDQLITALTSRVSILSAHLLDALIHCIQEDWKLPPLSSATCDNFPSTGMQARNYKFVQNSWSLNPGVQKKPNFLRRNLVKMDDRCSTRLGDTMEQIESHPSCGYLHCVMSRRL